MQRSRQPWRKLLRPAFAIPFLISVAFILWSVRFIEQFSYGNAAGDRYFSLFDDAMKAYMGR